LEVYGAFWVIDQIHAMGIATHELLVAVLNDFLHNPSIRSPKCELAARIRRNRLAV
jgi:Holliday junction resolvasome RuvABC ATP-dependent DNA helicase subunit